MLKHKRILLIASAVVFLALLFFIKNKSLFTNIVNYTNQQLNQEGLTYNKEIIGDLVNRDLDKDGVLDWEEGLWGTDPTKKDTNDDGVPDNVEIEKLKKVLGQTEQSQQGESLLINGENLTETDKFSREFFATIATLNQNGQMDQATVDKLSSSLAEHIQNSAPRKVFSFSNIKIINNDTLQDIKNYEYILADIFKRHTIYLSVADILAESMKGGENIDVKVLNKLDPLIKNVKGIVGEMAVMHVPQSLALLHLETINNFQKVVENLNDIKLIETDVILTISAISQYEKNDDELRFSIEKLISAIKQKLNN